MNYYLSRCSLREDKISKETEFYVNLLQSFLSDYLGIIISKKIREKVFVTAKCDKIL